MSAANLLNRALNVDNGEEFNTDYLLCPELDSAFGTISDIKFTSGTWTERDTQKERIWANLQLLWSIDSDEAREATKRDKVTVAQPLMLNFTDEGDLDKTNNQPLARLLKMFSIQASEHKDLQSLFNAFKHQTGYVKVKHRFLVNKEKEPLLDESGNQRVSAEVVAVSLEPAA